jgi:pectinesterase
MTHFPGGGRLSALTLFVLAPPSPLLHFNYNSMKIITSLFLTLTLAATCASATTNLYVNKSGANGAYTTVQAAITAAPAGTSNNRTIVYIAPGTYKEHLSISSSKKFLCLIGQTTDPTQVILTYNLNATSSNGSGGTVGTTGSTSTTISATDFIAKNITFKNSSHDDIAQAVAIKTVADRMAFQNCRFWGFQDTLYVTSGRQYFKSCYVTGDTDFIFGNATAVFDSCTVNESGAHGYYTAANTATTTAIGLVFLNCTLTGTPSTETDPDTGTKYSSVTSVSSNATYLGRPWQYSTSKSSVTYISCKMGTDVINVGWNPWDSGNTSPGNTTRYSEYNSMNLSGAALDISKRVSWSHQLTASQAAAYTLTNIFGSVSFWGSGYSDWGGSFVSWDPTAALNSVPSQ